MKAKFLKSKLAVFFFTMFLLGFFVGYDYAVVTSVKSSTEQIKNTDKFGSTKMDKTGLTDYTDEDIMNSN